MAETVFKQLLWVDFESTLGGGGMFLGLQCLSHLLYGVIFNYSTIINGGLEYKQEGCCPKSL